MEEARCKHGMIKNTCSLCKGIKQTGTLTSNHSGIAYIHENWWYNKRKSLSVGTDLGDRENDYNRDL